MNRSRLLLRGRNASFIQYMFVHPPTTVSLPTKHVPALCRRGPKQPAFSAVTIPYREKTTSRKPPGEKKKNKNKKSFDNTEEESFADLIARPHPTHEEILAKGTVDELREWVDEQWHDLEHAEPYGKYRGRDIMVKRLQANKKRKKQHFNTHVAMARVDTLLYLRHALHCGYKRLKDVPHREMAESLLGAGTKIRFASDAQVRVILKERYRYGESPLLQTFIQRDAVLRARAAETQAHQKRAEERRKQKEKLTAENEGGDNQQKEEKGRVEKQNEAG